MLYIDTNVIIDAVEGRKNRAGDDIGNAAADLFSVAASCRYRLVFSLWMLTELSRYKRLGETELLFAIVKKKVTLVDYTEDEVCEAKRRNPAHFQDELHGLLALKAHADCIVTRDLSGFKNFRGKIPIMRPEDLI